MDLCCKYCKVSFPSIVAFIEHDESEEHKKMMKIEIKEKSEEKINVVKDSPQAETTTKKTESAQPALLDLYQAGDVFTCDVCSVFVTGLVPYKQHLDGIKHKKKMRNQQLFEDLSNRFGDLSNRFGDLSLSSDGKMKKSDGSGDTKSDDDEDDTDSRSSIDDGDVKQQVVDFACKSSLADQSTSSNLMFPYVCHPCGNRFTGPEPYAQHLDSLMHKRRTKQIPLASVVTANVLQTFTCELCGVNVSGPVPYHQHLLSAKHAKKEQMQKMLQNVNFPLPDPLDACERRPTKAEIQNKEFELMLKVKDVMSSQQSLALPEDIECLSANEPIQLNVKK